MLKKMQQGRVIKHALVRGPDGVTRDARTQQLRDDEARRYCPDVYELVVYEYIQVEALREDRRRYHSAG